MAQITDPIAGNESFTTVNTLAPQIPELSIAEMDSYNDEVHNYLSNNIPQDVFTINYYDLKDEFRESAATDTLRILLG